MTGWPSRAVPQVMSSILSSMSTASTHPMNLRSRKDSFNTDSPILATRVAASEMIDSTDVGQLTSQLFSLERKVNANPFSFSGCHAHSSVVKPVQDADLLCSTGKFVRHGFVFMHWEHQCEVLSHFQVSRQPLSKGRRNRELESVFFPKWKRE